MNAGERNAACERHGIVLTYHGEWSAVHHDAEGGAFVEYGATKDEAVLALLKARYGIRAITSALTRKWYAYENAPQTVPFSAEYPTEIAAVVALADRLAGVPA